MFSESESEMGRLKTVHQTQHASSLELKFLRKIIEIVATRCQILSLKCTKFNFGWGS